METTKKEDKLIKNLGERIAELRKTKGYTQVTFSEKSGIHRAALAKIENGRVNPTVIVLNRISECLGIELHELLKMNVK
jgi:transcriptional regulator with XRE-family HTH domain